MKKSVFPFDGNPSENQICCDMCDVVEIILEILKEAGVSGVLIDRMPVNLIDYHNRWKRWSGVDISQAWQIKKNQKTVDCILQNNDEILFSFHNLRNLNKVDIDDVSVHLGDPQGFEKAEIAFRTVNPLWK